MSYQLDPLISRASRHTCQVEHVRPCLQQKHVVSFYADPGAALQAASFPMHKFQELACSSDALWCCVPITTLQMPSPVAERTLILISDICASCENWGVLCPRLPTLSLFCSGL